MTTTYFIAGAVFFVLSIAYSLFNKRRKKGKLYEKAIEDIDEAIDNRDWDAIDDARHRMWTNK